MNFKKTLPIYILAKKNVILRKTWKQMYSFNLYDRFANFRDCSKAWQMKLKLWHLILQEIVKISSGRKNQTFCQIYVLKFFKLAHYFSHSSECKPISDIHPIHTDHCFQFFPTKFGALPILQECPRDMPYLWRNSCVSNFTIVLIASVQLNWPSPEIHRATVLILADTYVIL